MKVPDIKKAFASAVSVVKFFCRTGRIRTLDTDKKDRLAVCNACPHVIKVTGAIWQCGICTCVVQAKAGLENEKCPKNLWLH